LQNVIKEDDHEANCTVCVEKGTMKCCRVEFGDSFRHFDDSKGDLLIL